MKNKSYYRILTDADNNFASCNETFQVNCTGHSSYPGDVRACTSRHDYYLIYLLSGTVYIKEPLQEKNLKSGDVIIFQPEQQFEYYKPSGTDMEYYWVHFTGYGVSELLNKCGLKTGCIMTAGIHEYICSRFRKLFDVFLIRDKFFAPESSNRLVSIILSIARSVSGQSSLSPNYSKISKSISFIHNNISRELKVESLAETEHMSSSRFRTVFREITGLSPQEYIILSKLNYACELMRQTDLSIREIGTAIGYNDPQYFSRIFKKRFGLSPSGYRNRSD